MKKENIKIGLEIKKLDRMLCRAMSYEARISGYDEITMMHGWIIRYLYSRRQEVVFQKDIEQQFSVGKSTVTNIIQLMEKKGYVLREPVSYDARLKRVMLTERGISIQQEMEEMARQMDVRLLTGIDEEELEIFLRVMDKIRENIGKEREDGQDIVTTCKGI